MFWNILVLRDATRDVTLLLFLLWRHCKVYWNLNVPNLRAQQKMMQIQISYKIFIVNRNYPLIHRVHKKFHLDHLHCFCLKCRQDWWDSGQIQIFAAQWLMGHFCMRICQSVRSILKRKIHTGAATPWMNTNDSCWSKTRSCQDDAFWYITRSYERSCWELEQNNFKKNEFLFWLQHLRISYLELSSDIYYIL